jgi:hypothetical protein
MSNSTWRNGGASLFFTTLTRVAGHLVAVLDLADAADLHADGRIELQRIAAGRRFGIAEHDADLEPDLVKKDHHGLAARHAAGQLAQRLAHQPRMKADMGIAHLAFELGARHECCHTIHHQHVDRPRPHQRVGDLERLLAGVGLADEQIVHIDAELPRIDGIERVLRVDEGAGAAPLLRLGNRVQRERRFARTFRPVDLDDPPARQPADPEREIEP